MLDRVQQKQQKIIGLFKCNYTKLGKSKQKKEGNSYKNYNLKFSAVGFYRTPWGKKYILVATP